MVSWSLTAFSFQGGETQLSRTGETPAHPSFQISGQIFFIQFEDELKLDSQVQTFTHSRGPGALSPQDLQVLPNPRGTQGQRLASLQTQCSAKHLPFLCSAASNFTTSSLSESICFGLYSF